MNAQHTLGPLRIGGKYNWRNQPDRLTYMGVKRHPGDRRDWHQFEKVQAPGIVWCEVLDEDLVHFEESECAVVAKAATADHAQGDKA